MKKLLIDVNLLKLIENLARSFSFFLSLQFLQIDDKLIKSFKDVYRNPIVFDANISRILHKYNELNQRIDLELAKEVFEDSLKVCNSLLNDIHFDQLLVSGDFTKNAALTGIYKYDENGQKREYDFYQDQIVLLEKKIFLCFTYSS